MGSKSVLTRYYLITLSTEDGECNLWFSLELGGFPSNKFIRNKAKEKFNLKNSVVTNIYEFNDEEDYLEFIKE